jgi:hypothetical protein
LVLKLTGFLSLLGVEHPDFVLGYVVLLSVFPSPLTKQPGRNNEQSECFFSHSHAKPSDSTILCWHEACRAIKIKVGLWGRWEVGEHKPETKPGKRRSRLLPLPEKYSHLRIFLP